MWFHFCTANHNPIGRSTLVDMADWFEAGLLDLGHKVTFSESHVEPNAINLFWEYFTDDMGTKLRELDITYGIIATEIPDGVGFNWRTEPEWKARFDAFPQVARGASFIWTMIESTLPFYSNYCPTGFMELGFSERLIPHYINNTPEYDFSFFGLKTPYRIKIMEELSRHAKIVWPEAFLTPKEVASLIAKTRIGLNFKQSEKWPIPSPTRLGRLMMAKRDIASERTPVTTRQGDIIELAPQGVHFTEFALTRLNSNWKQRAEQTFEKYQSQMPMRHIMEGILEQTTSKLSIKRNNKKSISLSAIAEPVLLKSINTWNIVFWNETYFAIMQSCGSVNVKEDIKQLQRKFGKNSIIHNKKLEDLLQYISVQPTNFKFTHLIKRIVMRLYEKISKQFKR